MKGTSSAAWCLLALGLAAAWNWPASALADDVGDGPIPAKNEVVMSPGMAITATTDVGTITVTAGKGLKRSYTWDGATRSVEMVPRDERWYGSLGLYFPGPGEHWENHKGITRGVVEEGQQHFKTADEALKWLAGRKYMPYVYRDDGLVVGWSKTPARKQLNVEVWQILINGKKPTKLAGSQGDKIKVTEPEEKAKGSR
jgi:hypothetical protein